MSTLIQRSFAGGEVAPAIYARADQTKYTTGLRTCRNFLVMRHGGVASRPGTGFIGETKDSTRQSRLIPFVFNDSQTYALEFGHLYMRVHKNGAQVLETGKIITAITQANPALVTTSLAHGYLTGDEVVLSGIAGMTQLNGRNLKIVFVNATQFTLKYLDGSAVNSLAFSPYASGGLSKRVFELVTPYVEADLFAIEIVQSADVITIAHPNYAPRDLSRFSDTNWTLSLIVFSPGISRPGAGTGSPVSAGTAVYEYKVTAISSETKEESYPGRGVSFAISGATNANPVQITAVGHPFATGDKVHIEGMVGMTELNGRIFTITFAGVNTFNLNGEDGTTYGVWTSAGTAQRPYIKVSAAATLTPAAYIDLSWGAVVGASEYNVYRSLNGVFGFIGIAGTNSFRDTDFSINTLDTPPEESSVFGEAGKFPSTVTFFQQRKVYANTNEETEKVFASRTANFKNFTISSPLQDDDAVTFGLTGRQVNEVKHMVDLSGLILFTSGGEWVAKGNANGVLVPGDVNPTQVSYNGSGDVPPLIVDNTVIYLQGRGSVIRDLGFDYQVDNYKGSDLTIFASHLFENYSILDWTFQQIPNSIIWAVRSDGILLGMTYIREHSVWGWHRHDFDGTIESVTAIPDGNEDALYMIVKREVGGRSVRFVEKLKTRKVEDIKDYVGMDCSLSLDGRNATPSHTMALTGGTLWNHDELLTLTSSLAFFAASDVGNEIRFYESDGAELRLEIDGYTSPTVVSVRPQKNVAVNLRVTAQSVWSRAVDSVSGLWHIEGKTVSVLGDGAVVANPNNDAYDVRTVSGGSVTFDKPYAVIHVGLPFTSDLHTLDIDAPQGETVTDKKKFVSKITVSMEKSRGIFAGTRPPTADSSLDGLFELKIRDEEGYDDPVALVTGTAEMIIEPSWNSHGRVFIRQTDPLPASILAVAPAGLTPMRG